MLEERENKAILMLKLSNEETNYKYDKIIKRKIQYNTFLYCIQIKNYSIDLIKKEYYRIYNSVY